MATEQDIFAFAVSQNKNLKNKPFRDVVDFAYSQNPNLRDAVKSPVIPKSTIPILGEGKAAAIRAQTGLEKAVEYAPMAGGMIGAGLGLISPVPGGAALGAGLGAGLGKGIEQIVSGPPSSMERAQEIGKEMTTAALGEEVFPMGLKAASNIFKATKDYAMRSAAGLMSASRGSKTSYESISRFLRGEGVETAIKEGKQVLRGMRETNPMERLNTAVAKNATETFDRVQGLIEKHRATLGKAVERVDTVLISKMAPYRIDMTKNAANYSQQLQDLITSDIRSAPFMQGADFTKIAESVDAMAKSPNMTIEQLIKFRRVLDENINWKRMPVGEKMPDALQALMKQIRGDIRTKLSNEANKKGIKIYDKIYAKFKDFADEWDSTLKKVYSSADESDMAQSNALDKFTNYFNKGGYKADILEATANKLPPGGKKEIERLLDHSAAYNLLNEIGAPSSMQAGIMRELLVNPTTLKMLKAGQPIEKVLQSHLLSRSARVGGAGVQLKE